MNTQKFCLHSQIIYGDLVETLGPYYQGYMKVVPYEFRKYCTSLRVSGQAIIFLIKFSHISFFFRHVPSSKVPLYKYFS